MNRNPNIFVRPKFSNYVTLGLVFGTIFVGIARAAEPKKVALLVGVNKYFKAGWTKLDYPEADVEAVAVELRRLGFQVTILKGSSAGQAQATLENIESTAKALVEPLGDDDLMLVMLSGHGQQLKFPDPADPKKEKDDGFYCPYKAVPSEPKTLFSLSHLTDDILRPNVGKKLVLVDACRDMPKDPGRGAKGIQGKTIALPENTAVLFGCRSGQQSYEDDKLGHGLFTHCLLEGLRGKAAREGRLTWSGLATYVEDRLSDDDMKALMPKSSPQEPIAAGGVGQLVLARIDVLTNSIGMKLNLISAGEFLMGSPETEFGSDGKTHEADEKQHRVKIMKPFYLGVYSVTQAEYEKVMGTNPSYFSSKGAGKDKVAGIDTRQFPVETVSWTEATEFCEKLSKTEGKKYRLPTEAEWEYACRAGTTTPFFFGNSLNGDKANCDGNFPYGSTTKGKYLERPTPVGSYPKNALELYDMSGNVYQWCGDWYDGDYYATSPANDPQGPNTGSYHVYRGGSWFRYAAYCRSADRGRSTPGNRDFYLGFRVALVPSSQ